MKNNENNLSTQTVVEQKGEKVHEIVTNASVYLTQVILIYVICHLFLIGAIVLFTLSSHNLALVLTAWGIYVLCFVGTFFAIRMTLHNNVYTIYDQVLEFGKNNGAEIAQHKNIDKIKLFKSFADKISRENTCSLVVYYKNEKFKYRTIFCVMEDGEKLVKKLYDLKNENLIEKKDN